MTNKGENMTLCTSWVECLGYAGRRRSAQITKSPTKTGGALLVFGLGEGQSGDHESICGKDCHAATTAIPGITM